MYEVHEIIGVSGARLATVRQKPQSLYFGGQTHLIAVKEATMNEQTDNEQWKDVKGFEGIYQISDHGRLKSYKKDKSGRILSNINKKGGYFSVVLCYQRKTRYCRLHVLVAEAFIPNPLNKPAINHKDANKQNNFVDNLEWVTPRENSLHAAKNVPASIAGMNHYNQFVRPKTIEQLSLDGRIIAEYRNSEEAQKATGVCQRNILQVANKTEYKPGKTRRQAGGFIWRFKNEIQTNIKFEQRELLPCSVGGRR